MWSRIKDKILQVKHAIGIEVSIQQDDSFIINIIIVRFSSNKFVVEKKFQDLRSFSDVKFPKKNLPAALIINGKGIIVKKVTTKESNLNYESLVGDIHPDDFFIQKTYFTESALISIGRKDQIEKIVSAVKELNFQLLNISLGFSSLEYLIPELEPLQNRILTSNYTIEFDEKHDPVEFFREAVSVTGQAEYLIGRHYLRSYDLLGYAAAVGIIIESIEVDPPVYTVYLTQARSNFKYNRLSKIIFSSLAASIFLILSLNYILQKYYSGLSSGPPYTSNQHTKAAGISNYQALIADNLNYFESHNWTKPAQTSYLADRIASLTPRNINFSSIEFYPRPVSFLQDQMWFKKDTVLIMGKCDDPGVINTFIKNISGLKEMNEVTLRSYLYNKEEGMGSFFLELVLK